MKHLLASLFLLAASHFALAAKPLNVVVLFADDWRFDVLGSLGHPVVKTPHLDQLASEGMLFTQNRVTTSICGVSRASLYTGQWMSRNGCIGFNMFKTPWEETYLGLVRANGYHLGHIGKWHNGQIPEKEFDFCRSYQVQHWHPQERAQQIHVTTRNENDALEFIRTRPENKPFAVTVCFFAPHAEDSHPLQFLPQTEHMHHYDGVEIPVPVNATEESWNRLPPFFSEKNEGRNRWGWRFDTPEKYQAMMKNYYRLVTGVDAACGRIIAELEKQGVKDETLIIFTTDNGYYHGERGLGDKWYPHEESIRVPLIIRDPRMPAAKRGTRNDDFTLNVDLAPTILAAAGIPAPDRMQGRDIAPLYLADEKPEWRDDFFYEHPVISNKDRIPPSQALVRKDWKYFYWPDHDYEQLFDLTSDPLEENDLARDPAHAGKLAEMRERFNELREAAK